MADTLVDTLKKIQPEVLAKVLQSSAKRKKEKDPDSGSDEHADKKPKAKKINEYAGWRVPSNNFTIEKIDLKESLTAEKFYETYVSKRRPVVMKGGLDDLNRLEKWRSSNKYLREKAGNVNVVVEVRSDNQDTFGRGKQVQMKFEKFLELVDNGDSMHYLTTQDVEADEGGRPDLLAPFMKLLREDFPLRPKLMGNLIPSNINLWMGNNKNGASSGLHHDYHDNLYIVLRGRKRFRLYSPEDSAKLYTLGTLEHVHPNGRINYKGETTTAYGADLKADAAAKAEKAKQKAEQMLEEAEQAVRDGKPGAEDQLNRAEERLDQAMEAILDAEVSDDEGAFGDRDDDFDDDDDDEEELGGLDGFDNDKDSDSGNDSKRTSKTIEEDEKDEEDFLEGGRRLVDMSVKNPNNFSKISVRQLNDEKELNEKFPMARDAKVAFCEVQAGDMLYLPASWFHEVTSFGDGDQGHLAMNYWFHPPDVRENFSQPYSSEFWSNDFEERFKS